MAHRNPLDQRREARGGFPYGKCPFTHLTDKPHRYWCVAQNPTGEPVRLRCTQRTDLSPLDLGEKEIEVAAGGDVVVVGGR